MVPDPGRRRRYVTTNPCPALNADPALDVDGNPIYRFDTDKSAWMAQHWPQTMPGRVATLACADPLLPRPGALDAQVTRVCGPDGQWEPVVESCPDPLSYFKPVDVGRFTVGYNYITLYQVTRVQCARDCALWSNCESFEYNPVLRSCALSTMPPSALQLEEDKPVTELSLNLGLELYEMDSANLARAPGLPLPSLANTGMSTAIKCSANLTILPVDVDGRAFYQTAEQLAGLTGCQELQGDLIVRHCHQDVTHLAWLRQLVHVTGVVEVSDCKWLKHLQGGLSRLRTIDSSFNGVALRISGNSVLEGAGLCTMLHTLCTEQEAVAAVVSNNPHLCTASPAWPESWQFEANAPPNACGCTRIVAQNYNPSALYDDGSCTAVSCQPQCELGTVGNCYSGASFDVLRFGCVQANHLRQCRTMLRGVSRQMKIFCDPCDNVVCNEPPTCHSAASGKCANGLCQYAPSPAGTPCDDGVDTTGPDTCNAEAVCSGQSSCSLLVPQDGGMASTTAAPEPSTLPGCELASNITVDDADGPPGFIATADEGTRWAVSSAEDAYPRPGGTFLLDRRAFKGNLTAYFRAQLPHGGTYRVEVIFPLVLDAADQVPVTIPDTTSGSQNLTLDLTTAGVMTLGTFEFAPGTGTVIISNAGTDDQFVVVDAVRFVCVGPPSPRRARRQSAAEGTGTITTQAGLDRLAGCGTLVDGDLVVDCGAAADDATAIRTLDPLSHVAVVHGAVIFRGCSSDLLAANQTAVMPALREIRGTHAHMALELTETTFALSPSKLFPKMEWLAGGVMMVNNSLLCPTEEWHDQFVSQGNADPNRCGCTDPNARNWNQQATFDDGTCLPDLCIDVVCDQVFACHEPGVCNKTTGQCDYKPLAVNSSCDDGLEYTENDHCRLDKFNNSVCIGTDKCVAKDFCGALECQELVSCHKGECIYQYLLAGDPCDDHLEYTTGETCQVSGVSDPSTGLNTTVCRGGLVNYCAQFDHHELQVRGGQACQTKVALAPGDVMSFNVYLPEGAKNGRLGLTIAGVTILSPTEPWLTLDGANQEFLVSTAEMQGHWTINMAPSHSWLEQNCLRTCYERAVLEKKRLRHRTNPHVEHWQVLCGHPGLCVGDEGTEGAEVCSVNRAPDVLCDRFTEQCLQHKDTKSTLQVQFWSHHLDRHRLVHLIRTIELQSDLVDATGHAVVFQDTSASDELNIHDYVAVLGFDVRPFDQFASAVTDDDGAFTLEWVMPVEAADTDPALQMASLKPFAVTTAVLHQFELESGEVGHRHSMITAMKHLEAVSDVNMVDRTGFHVSGTITMANLTAEYKEAIGVVDPTACPVPAGIRICAYDRTGSIVTCTETDDEGVWKLYVVTDMLLYVRAVKTGHDFAATHPPAGVPARVSKIEATRSTQYEFEGLDEDVDGLVFRDRTAVLVDVEFGGGSCMHPVGGAVFEFIPLDRAESSVAACALQRRGVFPVEAPARVHRFMLPAMNYSVKMVSATGLRSTLTGGVHLTGADVLNFFNGSAEVDPSEQQRGLVREVRFSTPAPPPAPPALAPVSAPDAQVPLPPLQKTIRWEYHPTPMVRLTLDGPFPRKECHDDSIEPAKKMYVMVQTKPYKARADVWEAYPDHLQCFDVSGSIQFDGGLTRDTGLESVDLETDQDGAAAKESIATLEVTAGSPNIVSPYTVELKARYEQYHPKGGFKPWTDADIGQNYGRAYVLGIIEGNTRIGTANFAMKVPEYVPFMILRDPPGSGSSASVSRSYSRSLSFSLGFGADVNVDMAFDIGGYYKNPGSQNCFGLLVGTSITQQCSNWGVSSNSEGAASVKISTKSSTKNDKGNSVQVDVSLDLSTSGDAGLAGAAADLFVSPALSLEFYTSAKISVPPGKCQAVRTEIDTW